MKPVNAAPEPEPNDIAAAVIYVVPTRGGYEAVVENRRDLPDSLLGPVVREAADTIEGVHDRARNSWGRPLR